MEIRKVNSFCIESEQSRKFDYAFYFTTATEEEFKELLDNYLSENGPQDDSKFNPGIFTAYVAKNGHYIHTRRDRVFHPIP